MMHYTALASVYMPYLLMPWILSVQNHAVCYLLLYHGDSVRGIMLRNCIATPYHGFFVCSMEYTV